MLILLVFGGTLGFVLAGTDGTIGQRVAGIALLTVLASLGFAVYGPGF